MNYECQNETIRNLGKRRRLLLDVLEDDTKGIVSDELKMKLEIAYQKLDECYTYVPEITERDMWLDHYWDKKEQIDEAISYGEGLENQIRYAILEAEVHVVLSEIEACIYTDSDLADALNDWICGEMDAERDYEMYGCD